MFKKLILFTLILLDVNLFAQDEKSNYFRDFTLNDFSGARYNLAEIIKSSKVTILSFWASWCEPCLRELVELKDIYDKYHTNGLKVVAVNIDSKNDLIKAKRFVLQNKLKYIFLYDDRGDVRKKYNIESLPQMFIFDASGILNFYHKGFKDITIIEREVKELMGKN